MTADRVGEPQDGLGAVLAARLTRYEEEWLWHEQDAERRAGHGHHMSQLLYRLPRDGRTTDMAASIVAMLADLRAAVEALRLGEGTQAEAVERS